MVPWNYRPTHLNDKKSAAKSQPAPEGAHVQPPLLPPPQRNGAIAAVTTPAESSAGVLPAASPSGTGANREVTTPEQLRRVLLDFDEQCGGSEGAGARPGPTPAPALIRSPSAQYRPSLVPKGAAAPASSSGRVAPSLPEERAQAMQRWGVTQDVLEVCTERLREWFATQIVQPLHCAVQTAHARVATTAAALGTNITSPGPLCQLGDSSGPHSADDVLVVAQARAAVEQQLRQAGRPDEQQLRDHWQALIKYERLASLLRGEFPPNILPPAPAGYVATRIQSLANGTCMLDFAWNAGGEWNGKAWSPELPTDSALLLYLFAAFLAAPHWDFTADDPSRIEGPGGVLYLGKLPPRMASDYFAVIPVRPPASSKASGVLGLQLGSQQPLVCAMISGELVLVESGHNALFDVLVLVLHHCHQKGNMLGARSLAQLNLGEIVQPAAPAFLAAAVKLKRRFLW